MGHLTRAGAMFAVGVMLAAGGRAAAEVTTVFHDETFDPANWQVSTMTEGNAGTVTASQVLTGGHTGAYRRINITVNAAYPYPHSSVYSFHKLAGASFDPATQGAIESIDYAEDGILFPGGFGNGMQTGLTIWQDGQLFRSGGLRANQFSWVAQSQNGLTETDVFRCLNDKNVHPDFSATGSPMEFGFFRTLVTTDYSLTFATGMDDWSVTIHSVPEPATMLLLALGGVGLLRRARR
jgi:hypothetical protein